MQIGYLTFLGDFVGDVTLSLCEGNASSNGVPDTASWKL